MARRLLPCTPRLAPAPPAAHRRPPPVLRPNPPWQSLGIAPPLVARMLQHCPALFSYPAADRAAPLLAELMGERLGLQPMQVCGRRMCVRFFACNVGLPLQLAHSSSFQTRTPAPPSPATPLPPPSLARPLVRRRQRFSCTAPRWGTRATSCLQSSAWWWSSTRSAGRRRPRRRTRSAPEAGARVPIPRLRRTAAA